MKFAMTAGEIMGVFFSFFMKKEKKIICKNLDIVYGKEKFSDKEKKEFIIKNFRNYGRGLFEFIKISVSPAEEIAKLVKEVYGLEFFYKAKEEGRSLIGVTAHFGNWELIPIYLKFKGFNIGVIGKKLFDDKIDKIVNSARTKIGVKAYDRDIVSRNMIKELKENGLMLGVLTDQDTDVDSIIVPFLGVDAKTPIGPAVLAMHYNSYLCTLFSVRRKDGYYDLIINKPYDINKDDDIEKIVRFYNDDISKMIIKYPEQWAWIHDRFKSTIKNIR
jgi:KDO2-lipid IV(A) lauroyltransferase